MRQRGTTSFTAEECREASESGSIVFIYDETADKMQKDQF